MRFFLRSNRISEYADRSTPLVCCDAIHSVLICLVYALFSCQGTRDAMAAFFCLLIAREKENRHDIQTGIPAWIIMPAFAFIAFAFGD